MYSETGEARVELALRDPSGSRFLVTRSFDGKEKRLALKTPDGAFKGPAAEGRLIDLVWPDAASASDPSEALASVLTRSVYLQQDLIRQFVEAASDQERFAAVSELVGAGRVTELQASLERGKRAWSTATNQRQEELRPLRERSAIVEARLGEMTARASKPGRPITTDAWGKWWQTVVSLGVKVVRVEAASREAPAAIDNSIKQLDALRRTTERRLQALAQAKAEAAGLATRAPPEIPPLRERLASARGEVDDLRRAVTEEQARLADARRQQVEIKEKTEQLKALAALALKQLDEHCPVCAQTYDKEATRRRLEGIVKSGAATLQTSAPDKITALLGAVALKEKELGAAELALRAAEQAVNERQLAQQALSKRLVELGVVTSDIASIRAAVELAIGECEALTQRLLDLQRAGESLALGLAQSTDEATVGELRREGEALRGQLGEIEKVIVGRNQTGETAQRVIEALREAASAVVEERLGAMGPLLQNIYARIDPHPAFRTVSFFSRVVRGKGQLSTVVSDPVAKKECDLPASILSSSQVNALAVSVFLAMNVGVQRPPLAVAMLDDPLQSLDDINLLGLVDLLRRTKDRRQLCVSTHDGRFGNLLSRKLRPNSEKGRTVVIELDGWSREGPVVATREVRSDAVPLRLVAAQAS
jgi:hypothetical protein